MVTPDLRALDAQVAEALNLPMEPPCPRYHTTDDAECDQGEWSGWCYSCGMPISEVAPEPLRFSSDPAACQAMEVALEQRGLHLDYALALLEATRDPSAPYPVLAVSLWRMLRASCEVRVRVALKVVEESK